MRNELIKSLEEFIPSEQMATILSTAACEPNEDEFLANVLANLRRKNPKDSELPQGYEIVPKMYIDEDPRTHEPIVDDDGRVATTHAGWAIKYTNGDEVPHYCGSMGEWKIKIEHIAAWDDREKAITYANFWHAQSISRKVRPPTAVSCKDLSLPFIPVDKPDRGSKINFQMTVEQTQRIDSYLRGLRATNASIDGEPVKNRVDVIRFLLEK